MTLNKKLTIVSSIFFVFILLLNISIVSADYIHGQYWDKIDWSNESGTTNYHAGDGYSAPNTLYYDVTDDYELLQSTYNDSTVTEITEFNENGDLGYYRSEVDYPNGNYKFEDKEYLDDGYMYKSNYVTSNADSTRIQSYNEDIYLGKLENDNVEYSNGDYKNHLKHTYDDGSVTDMIFTPGLKSGREYRPDGTLEKEYKNFDDDTLIEYQYYYPDGTLEREGANSHVSPYSKSNKTYYPDGSLKSEFEESDFHNSNYTFHDNQEGLIYNAVQKDSTSLDGIEFLINRQNIVDSDQTVIYDYENIYNIDYSHVGTDTQNLNPNTDFYINIESQYDGSDNLYNLKVNHPDYENSLINVEYNLPR
jgi:hypothetical protein